SPSQAHTLAGRCAFRVVARQAHTVLAGVYLAQCRPHLAIDEARAALELHRHTGYRLGEARTLVLLGKAVAPDDRSAAVGHWRRALGVFTDIGTSEAEQVRGLLPDPR